MTTPLTETEIAELSHMLAKSMDEGIHHEMRDKWRTWLGHRLVEYALPLLTSARRAAELEREVAGLKENARRDQAHLLTYQIEAAHRRGDIDSARRLDEMRNKLTIAARPDDGGVRWRRMTEKCQTCGVPRGVMCRRDCPGLAAASAADRKESGEG